MQAGTHLTFLYLNCMDTRLIPPLYLEGTAEEGKLYTHRTCLKKENKNYSRKMKLFDLTFI